MVLFAWVSVAARVAWADGEPAVLVLEVAPGTDIDVERLRAALRAELAMQVVPPEDARAASARGKVEVRTDPEKKKLVVSYRTLGAPLRREVDLPGDAAATSSTIVLLAGNLARNEAEDVLAEMRTTKPSVESKRQASAAAGSPVQDAFDAAAPEPKKPTALPELEGSAVAWSSTLALVNVGFELKSPRYRVAVGDYGQFYFLTGFSGVGPHAADRFGVSFEVGMGPYFADGKVYFATGFGFSFVGRIAHGGGSAFFGSYRMRLGFQPARHFGVFVGVGMGVVETSSQSPVRDLDTPFGGEVFAGIHF
jgi:hypothetical protein